MRPLMWILTWIAVGIGGALGAASVIMLSASHQSGAQVPSVTAGSDEPPVIAPRHKTGEPSRRLILVSQRHNSVTTD